MALDEKKKSRFQGFNGRLVYGFPWFKMISFKLYDQDVKPNCRLNPIFNRQFFCLNHHTAMAGQGNRFQVLSEPPYCDGGVNGNTLQVLPELPYCGGGSTV